MPLGHLIQKGERCQAGLHHNPRLLFCGGSAEPVKRQDPRWTSWQITVPTEALYPESTKNLTSQEGHDPMIETRKSLKGQHGGVTTCRWPVSVWRHCAHHRVSGGDGGWEPRQGRVPRVAGHVLAPHRRAHGVAWAPFGSSGEVKCTEHMTQHLPKRSENSWHTESCKEVVAARPGLPVTAATPPSVQPHGGILNAFCYPKAA